MAPGAGTLSFQDLILRLQTYWSQQGCAVLQPYDLTVGAGTFHPATTLRALGPEPIAATQNAEGEPQSAPPLLFEISASQLKS